MASLNADQPGQQAGGRQLSVAAGIVLVAAGAILVFAFTGASPHWLNLRVVGVILILAGVLGLAVPRLPRLTRGGLRRWPKPPPSGRGQSPRGRPPGLSGAPRAGNGRVTAANDLHRAAHDPPARSPAGDR